MKYYNLNIKINDDLNSSLSPAELWLDCRKAAPIFFGSSTKNDLINGTAPFVTKAKNEAIEFFKIGTNKGLSRLVTIDSGFIWIYKIIDEDRFGKEFQFIYNKTGEDVIPKYYPIEVIKKIEISKAPYILAAMKSSQAFARGTFTEINKNNSKYSGNIAAIKSVLNDLNNFKINPFRCLSSVELETLIAKIFEEHGSFVPAHRGAILKDVDLFVDIDNADSKIKKQFNLFNKISIQVKIDISESTDITDLKKFLQTKSNFLITAEETYNLSLIEFKNQYLNIQWLQEQLNVLPNTNQWFNKSLDWLPKHCWLQ